ncbi:DMT family transporter [Pseudobdellovibrio sp. HCB154]|uniref:DMT family transporter n=1 Tax=Pseudobdellovibrio sp. HCB154 TaxID=3386277 RepID=UPI0039172070
MLHISLYFIALVSLSTSPNWAKLNHMSSVTLGFYRLAGASLLLFLYMLFAKKLKKINFDRNLVWALSSGFFFFLHLWTYKYASKHTLVSNTMILFATNPVWATLGGQVFFKEYIKPRVIYSYMLALIGVFMLVAQNLQLTPENHLGNVAALVSAFFYALYMLTSKKARLHMANNDFSLIQYSTCALMFAIAVLSTDAPMTGFDAISWWSVLGLIIFPTFLGHMSFTYLVKHMNLGLMSCGKLIEPIIATIFAYFLFNEHLGSNAIYAFILTGVSVLILFWPTINKRANMHE